MTNQIYLDNAATTQADKEVVKAMLPYFSEKYGNASSAHLLGIEARKAVEESRAIIAKSIGALPEEIIFTSSGTEANNLALKGIAWNSGKKHIVTTKIEHDCILKVCKWLETQGFKVTYLNVDSEGFVNMGELKENITKDTALVSVIYGNNEIGTIQNIEEIGKICREKGVYFHTDACQSYMKIPIDVSKQNLDLVTLNAHKVHGPKGVGALYIKRGINLTPLMHGGGQEKELRSGTENVAGIVGFAKAVQIAKKQDLEKMINLRDTLIKEILKIPDTKLNGAVGEHRLCNNVNISFSNVEGESIGGFLSDYGICISTGSACSSKSLQASHVLTAIGLDALEANSSIRISLSRFNNEKEIDKFIKVLPIVIKRLRAISPFAREKK